MQESQTTQHNTTFKDTPIFDGALFEAFIQECLQAKIEITNSNPIYSLIAKTRYALSQSSPLSTEDKNLLDCLVDNIDTPMKVAIIGQFSSGKSTFLNALLGKEVLPSGITPVTAKVCEITYGEEVTLEIFYKNKKSSAKPIEYLNEVDDIENAKIEYYKLSVPLELLKEVSFLDTPGFNSQNESDTDVTNSILEKVDGIIWLTLIDNVGKNSEKEILQTHLKRYAHKSLCILNQKDRLKNQEEIDTSVTYAKKAFEGFFEEIIAISAKEAIEALQKQEQEKQALRKASDNFFQTGLLSHYNAQENKARHEENIKTSKTLEGEALSLFERSNIKAVLDFIYNIIKPQALQAKEYRILRELRTLLIHQKRKLHTINLSYKELNKLLQVYGQKVRFQALQSGMEKNFQKLFSTLETNLDSLTHKIFNSFEFRSVEFTRATKGFLGIQKQITYTKEISALPKERLMSELCNDENTYAREMKKFGFMLNEFGKTFCDFVKTQERELRHDVNFWCESSSQATRCKNQSSTDTNKCFQPEVLWSEILCDYEKAQDECVYMLRSELEFLQKMLVLNFQNTIMLSLEKLNFDVENALTKHKSNPETLPLYNPTLENVRDIINLGLHFQMCQEKLSLNFPIYKKALWNLMQHITKVSEEKQEMILQWINENKHKYTILQNCDDVIKNYKL